MKKNHTNSSSLTYQTNPYGVADIESGAPLEGQVMIYSPACNLWGSMNLTTKNPVPILAWGLSIKNPLLFTTMYDETQSYDMPKWKYDGVNYDHISCDCFLDSSQTGHDCLCRFGCVPFPIDPWGEEECSGVGRVDANYLCSSLTLGGSREQLSQLVSSREICLRKIDQISCQNVCR